jgi:negative regulator of replication initiation
MAPATGDYEGLTDDELEAMIASTEQLSGEDASSWASRALRIDAEYKAKAKARREAPEEPVTAPTASEEMHPAEDAAQ